MDYQVFSTPQFKKDIQYYLKKKRYLKVTDDISEIVEELEKGNFLGVEIKGLDLPEGESSYKVRIANSSINVGKSNGFRLIYYVVESSQEIFLITIYSKKEREDVSSRDIIKLLKKLD